jgi:hypothetical protein
MLWVLLLIVMFSTVALPIWAVHKFERSTASPPFDGSPEVADEEEGGFQATVIAMMYWLMLAGLATALGYVMWWWGTNVPRHAEEWFGTPTQTESPIPLLGAWGDSFAPWAAVLNAFALIAALVSIRLQGAELRDQRIEMQRARKAQEQQANSQVLANRLQAHANVLASTANIATLTVELVERDREVHGIKNRLSALAINIQRARTKEEKAEFIPQVTLAKSYLRDAEQQRMKLYVERKKAETVGEIVMLAMQEAQPDDSTDILSDLVKMSSYVDPDLRDSEEPD